jgi:hypothetical protein
MIDIINSCIIYTAASEKKIYVIDTDSIGGIDMESSRREQEVLTS